MPCYNDVTMGMEGEPPIGNGDEKSPDAVGNTGEKLPNVQCPACLEKGEVRLLTIPAKDVATNPKAEPSYKAICTAPSKVSSGKECGMSETFLGTTGKPSDSDVGAALEQKYLKGLGAPVKRR